MAVKLQAVGFEAPTGEVIVQYLRCVVKNPRGEGMMFYSRPRMLCCMLGPNGIPRDAHAGMQEMDADAHNLLLMEPASRA